MAIVYVIRGDFGRYWNDNTGWTRNEREATDFEDYNHARRVADSLGANEVLMHQTDTRVRRWEKEDARKARAKANRKAREDALRSCGLRKVRGNLGGIYWE